MREVKASLISFLKNHNFIITSCSGFQGPYAGIGGQHDPAKSVSAVEVLEQRLSVLSFGVVLNTKHLSLEHWSAPVLSGPMISARRLDLVHRIIGVILHDWKSLIVHLSSHQRKTARLFNTKAAPNGLETPTLPHGRKYPLVFKVFIQDAVVVQRFFVRQAIFPIVQQAN